MRTRDDFIGEGRAPSFVDAQRRAMPWTDDAACAVEPYSSWKSWFVEPASGREHPGTVLKCFEVCKACSVRVPCLRDALQQTYTPGGTCGIWGGTTMTERRAAWRLASTATKPDPDFNLPSSAESARGKFVSAAPVGDRLTVRDRHDLVEGLVDAFEASFDERAKLWSERLVALRAAQAGAVVHESPVLVGSTNRPAPRLASMTS